MQQHSMLTETRLDKNLWMDTWPLTPFSHKLRAMCSTTSIGRRALANICTIFKGTRHLLTGPTENGDLSPVGPKWGEGAALAGISVSKEQSPPALDTAGGPCLAHPPKLKLCQEAQTYTISSTKSKRASLTLN